MFSSRSQEEPESALEAAARQYARAGWSVTSRTANVITLVHNQDTVRISVSSDDQNDKQNDKIVIDGPPLSPFSVTGRQRAWLFLGIMLVIVLGAARLVGFL